jgi:hypothetical protein
MSSLLGISCDAMTTQRPLQSFRAIVVRKKLGLTLDSEKTNGERVYRVIEPQAA